MRSKNKRPHREKNCIILSDDIFSGLRLLRGEETNEKIVLSKNTLNSLPTNESICVLKIITQMSYIVEITGK